MHRAFSCPRRYIHLSTVCSKNVTRGVIGQIHAITHVRRTVWLKAVDLRACTPYIENGTPSVCALRSSRCLINGPTVRYDFAARTYCTSCHPCIFRRIQPEFTFMRTYKVPHYHRRSHILPLSLSLSLPRRYRSIISVSFMRIRDNNEARRHDLD